LGNLNRKPYPGNFTVATIATYTEVPFYHYYSVARCLRNFSFFAS